MNKVKGKNVNGVQMRVWSEEGGVRGESEE